MDIISTIAAYGPWSWAVAGVILLALELVLPGGVLLWLGVAAIATGVAVLAVPIDWPWQFLLFGVLSLVLIVVWLRFWRNRQPASDRPFLNKRAERFIGHELALDEPITGGFGRLWLEDTIWRIAGPDLPAGQRIRIVGADGAVLKVEPVG